MFSRLAGNTTVNDNKNTWTVAITIKPINIAEPFDLNQRDRFLVDWNSLKIGPTDQGSAFVKIKWGKVDFDQLVAAGVGKVWRVHLAEKALWGGK